MILRDYQKDCVNKILSSFFMGDDNTLIHLAPGAGKTIIFCELIKRCLKISKDMRAIIVVPKNILILQTVEKLKRFVPASNIGIYCAGLNSKDLTKQFTVSSIQSLCFCEEMPLTNVLIFDECHRANMEDVGSNHAVVYDRLKSLRPQMKLLGVTATPYKKNKYIYGDDLFWSEPVFTKAIGELQGEGYLAPIVYTNSSKDAEIDYSHLKKTGGDYSIVDIETEIFKDEHKIKLQVEDALLKTKDRKKVIWLTVSIHHAGWVYTELLLRDIDAMMIHSRQKSSTREANFINFSEGNAKHLVSVLIASEGLDIPKCDCLVFMRPTRSITLYLQAAGRVMRIAPDKKSGLLLDYGNVVKNLGKVTEVDVDTTPVKMKLCPICDAYLDTSEKECHCGYKFIVLKVERTQEKRDIFKNLTSTAWNNGLYKITNIRLSEYTSRKGNKCMKVSYECFLEVIVVEYFVMWNLHTFEHIHPKHNQNEGITIKDFISRHKNNLIIPTSIRLKKNKDGYNEIIQRNYL